MEEKKETGKTIKIISITMLLLGILIGITIGVKRGKQLAFKEQIYHAPPEKQEKTNQKMNCTWIEERNSDIITIICQKEQKEE